MYAKRNELAMDYGISIATVDRYLRDMRSNRKYSSAILRPTKKCTRVSTEAFRAYMEERSKL